VIALEDEDGIDGSFDRAMAREMRADARRARATSRYIVEAADCAGTIAERDCGASFDSCLAAGRELRAKYGRSVAIIAYNADGCDVDTNGLTDDERDAFAEAVS
jgi:hypothetical protein